MLSVPRNPMADRSGTGIRLPCGDTTSRPGCALSAVPRATGSGLVSPSGHPLAACARSTVSAMGSHLPVTMAGALGPRRLRRSSCSGDEAHPPDRGHLSPARIRRHLTQQQMPSVRSVRARLGGDQLAVALHEVADRRRRTILRMTEVHPGAPGFAASGFLRLRRADERSPAPDGTTVDSWISHRAASSSSVCP